MSQPANKSLPQEGEAEGKPEINLPSWKCEWEDVEKFTVGDPKKLVCHGEYVESFIGSVSILVSDKEFEWVLYPLDVIVSENSSITLLVTSYKAGEFSDFKFAVVGESNNGMTGFEVEPLSWQVQSVIENPQNPQGYGPSEPIYLTWPTWLWWGWGLALLWFFSILVTKWVKSYKRIEQRRRLSAYSTPRSPYHQYHWEMRKIRRKYQNPSYIKKVQREGTAGEYLSELNNSLRLYLLRQLQMPALVWKSHQIVEEIKDHHRAVFKALGSEIRQTISEFEKAESSSDVIGMDDCRQFHQMSYHMVESIREVVES